MLSAKVTAQNVQKRAQKSGATTVSVQNPVPTLHLPEKNGLNPKMLSPESAPLGASR